ncbi:MAG: MerR family transcriptional regulator [Mediterranea sp.]|jgi:DNA-binding transcriptional MerR regulator|nr:MerR family transcriptional regulator [Mediterranea sp.]
MKKKDQKLYYYIGEVAEMLDVSETTLRYWERMFPELQPRRSGRGVRHYSKADINTIRMIHYLVKERGMTVAGAIRQLKTNKEAVVHTFEVLQRLETVRTELLDMQRALNSFTYEQMEKLAK